LERPIGRRSSDAERVAGLRRGRWLVPSESERLVGITKNLAGQKKAG